MANTLGSIHEFAGHTPNRYHLGSRPTATSPFPGYFPDSTLPYQHYPAAYPQGWGSRMSESEQYFNDTVTKLLKVQNEMKNVIDKISLRMTEVENSLKGTTTSSSSDEKKRVSPQLSVSDRGCANYA